MIVGGVTQIGKKTVSGWLIVALGSASTHLVAKVESSMSSQILLMMMLLTLAPEHFVMLLFKLNLFGLFLHPTWLSTYLR